MDWRDQLAEIEQDRKTFSLLFQCIFAVSVFGVIVWGLLSAVGVI